MKVLLLGGPFDWRTLNLPKDHVSPSVYLPIPLEAVDYRMALVEGPDEPSYQPQDHLRVAEYISGEDIITHDIALGKPVYCGRIYNFVGIR